MLRNIFTKIPGISTFSDFTLSSQPCRMKTLKPFSPVPDAHRRVVKKSDQPQARIFRRSSSVPPVKPKLNKAGARLVAKPWSHNVRERPRPRTFSQNSTTKYENESNSSNKILKSTTHHENELTSSNNIVNSTMKRENELQPSNKVFKSTTIHENESDSPNRVLKLSSRDDFESKNILKTDPPKNKDQNKSTEKSDNKEYDDIEIVEQYELEASSPRKNRTEKGFNVFESMSNPERENCPVEHLQPNNLKPFGSCENQFFPTILKSKSKPVIQYPEMVEETQPENTRSSKDPKGIKSPRDSGNIPRRQYSTMYKPVASLNNLKNENVKTIGLSRIKSQNYISNQKFDENRNKNVCEQKLRTSKRELHNHGVNMFDLPADSYYCPTSYLKLINKTENILQHSKATDKTMIPVRGKYYTLGSGQENLSTVITDVKPVLSKNCVLNSNQNLLKQPLLSTVLKVSNNTLKTSTAASIRDRRPYEPSRCEPDPPKPKCFLPSKLRLKPPKCITKPPPCPTEDSCERADDCLTEIQKKLPTLKLNACPCLEPEVPDQSPKLRRLRLKFEDPPRICPSVSECPERADDTRVEKEKKLKPHIPHGCACVETPPMIDIPLKRLVKTCQPEVKCYPIRPPCPEPEPCHRADDCLEEKLKELPVLVPAYCPCIEPPPIVESPPLRRLNLKVDEPPRICPDSDCVCGVDCPRADDNLKVKPKKLPTIYSGDCPCIERHIVDVPPLKRLECKEEEECLESDPCTSYPRADLGCWEYYIPEKEPHKPKEKKLANYHGKRSYNTDCKTCLSEQSIKYDALPAMEKKEISKSELNFKDYKKSSDLTSNKECLSQCIKKSNNIAQCKNLLNKLYNLENQNNELIFDNVSNKSQTQTFSKRISSTSLKKESPLLTPNVRGLCTSVNNPLGSAPKRYVSRIKKSGNDKGKTKGKSKKCLDEHQKKCKQANYDECDKFGECRPRFVLKECKTEKCVKDMKTMCDKDNPYICCEKKKSPYPSFSEVLDERIAPFSSTTEWSCNNKKFGFYPTPDKRRIIDPNKPDQEAYGTLAGIRENSTSLLKKSENDTTSLCSLSKRQMSSSSSIQKDFVKTYGFLSSTTPSKISFCYKSSKKGSKKQKPAPYKLKTREEKLTKFNLEHCVPVAPRDPTCKRMMPVVCQKLEAPFPAFTDCLDEELADNLAECPLERSKQDTIQPLFHPPVDLKVLQPVEPQVGKIDPKVEETCVRCKLNLKNEGITQTCRDFGKYVKPMKQKDYIKDRKKELCCGNMRQKRHFSMRSTSNVLFDVPKRNISFYLKKNDVNFFTKRSYHALCKKVENNLAVEVDDQLKDIPQYIGTDMEDNKKYVKMRNVQMRTDNFHKRHRLSKLKIIDQTLKRYYSSSKISNDQIQMQLQRLLYTTSQLLKPKRDNRNRKQMKVNKNTKSNTNNTSPPFHAMEEKFRILQPQYPILQEIPTPRSSPYANVDRIPSALELQRLRKKLGLISQEVRQNCATIDESVQPTIEIVRKDCKKKQKMPEKISRSDYGAQKLDEGEEMLPEKKYELVSKDDKPNTCTVKEPIDDKIQPELVVDINHADKTKHICCKYMLKNSSNDDTTNLVHDNLLYCSEDRKENLVCPDPKLCPKICSGTLPKSPCPKPSPPKCNKSLSKYAVIWNKIVNYFKARPNCPSPDEWKKKALREKAEKAAKAAGLCVFDPKDTGKPLRCAPLPKVILPPCKRCKSTKKENDDCPSNTEQKRCFGTSCQTINWFKPNTLKPVNYLKELSLINSQTGNICSVGKTFLLQNFQPTSITGVPKMYWNNRGTLYCSLSNSLALTQTMKLEVVPKRFYSKSSNLRNVEKGSKQLEDDKKEKVANTFLEDSPVSYSDKDKEEVEAKVEQSHSSYNINRKVFEMNDDLVLAYKLQLCKFETGDPFGLNQVKVLQDYFSKDDFIPDMSYEELEQLKTRVMVKHLDTVLNKLKKEKKLKC